MANQRLPEIQMDPATARRQLIRLLQDAHAGEWAAALAYEGHAISVPEPFKSEIRKIQSEELDHRRRLFALLSELGQSPRASREFLMTVIGHFISTFCRIGGFLIPMYGAGKLERGNIVEYEVAARLSLLAGVPQFVEDLIEFAEIEWDHEQYFRRQTLSHWAMKWLPMWPATASRALIREELKGFKVQLEARKSAAPVGSQSKTQIS